MTTFDVYGLGNALVDMEYGVDDGFLQRHGVDKGHMTLVDEPRLDLLVGHLRDLSVKRMSGGSAANSLIAAQSFGARTHYSCKVASDEVGQFFVDDLRRMGVSTNPHPKNVAGKSGRCLVLVTPDAERSMSTFLGISDQLGEREIDPAGLRASRYLYIEGYLSSSQTARAAAVACRDMAQADGVKIVMTLSDTSMIRLFRDQLVAIMGNGVEHLFCNEEEALAWAGTDRLDVAAHELADIARSVYITLGARGSLVVSRRSRQEVGGFPVKPIDTNGAGDIYAGACLAGWTTGMPEAVAARFGNFVAAHLTTCYGARLPSASDYHDLLERFRQLAF